jgi:RNA polymerase sigma-70 factor (ECF subfamily)
MPLDIQAEVRDAFVRYRDHGCVDALAMVFDRTAQGLLLVACHLAGPGVDAEDLVQETFVQAIRNAHVYDPGRPLEPWLLDILTNAARNARRRAAHRPDPDRVRAEAAEDPVQRAEQRELARTLQAAIDRLPRRPREVLALHLAHGMTPTEIAHALGRPVGSVKSWLHRGLRRLRDLLPATLAALLASSPRAAARLAAIRSTLLAGGPPPAPIAGGGERVATAAPPRAALRATVASLGGAAFAALASAWLALSGERSTLAPTAATTRVAEHRDAAPGGPEPERSHAASTADAPCELLVDARWADGTPASIAVAVEPVHAPDPRLVRVDAATDALGRALLTLPEPGRFRVQPDRAPARTVALRSGPNHVDVVVAPGRHVAGRVLDPDDAPVAGARIWLSSEQGRGDGAFVATTSVDGSFAVRDVPAGRALAAFADGFAPTRFEPVAAGEGEDVAAIELCFERAAGTVHVAVVDPAGRPVTDALVQIGASDADGDGDGLADDCRPPPPWLGRTDADGRTVCRQVPLDLRVPCFARAAAFAAVGGWLQVGDAPHETTGRLPPSASVSGLLRDPDGSPTSAHVVAQRLDAWPVPRDQSPEWCFANVLAAADGTWTLTGVPIGAALLEARRGDRFAQVERRIAAHGNPPWHARLGGGGRVAGIVRCADGSPLHGCRVELCAGDDAHAVELLPGGAFAIDRLGERPYELLLREPAELGDAILLRRGGIRPGDQLDVVVPAAAAPSAGVRGRALAADGTPLPCVELSRIDGWLLRVVPCDGDGRFATAGLPPGPFALLGGTFPYACWRRIELLGGDVVELGEVRGTAHAEVRVTIPAERRRAELEANLVIAGTFAMTAVARWNAPGDTVHLPTPAADCVLSLFDGGVIVFQQRLCLAPGAVEEVHAPPASSTRFHAVMRTAEPNNGTAIVWRIQGHGVDWRGHSQPRQPGRRMQWQLAAAVPPGRYRLTATADTGERADVELDVADEALQVERVPHMVELR